MPWGRVDDGHYDHPKVRKIPVEIRNAADGLYWRAISWCNRWLTDGYLTTSDIELLDGTPDQVAALLKVKLWERRGGRIHVHDYLVFNKSKAEVLEERQKRSDAGRQGGLASGLSRRKEEPKQPRKRPAKQPRTNGEAGRSPTVEPPSRPVPSHDSLVGTSPTGLNWRARGDGAASNPDGR